MGKYWRWKKAIKKGMQLLFGKKSSVSKVYPCSVCGEQVAYNSVHCMKCQRWVHHHCYDMPRQVSLLSCPDVFVCSIYLGRVKVRV